MFAITCIFVRSFAIVNSVGADRLAATVWPTFTSRETTTPSIGEVIVVCARFTFARQSAASACRTCAFACSTCACDCCTCVCDNCTCACDCAMPAPDDDCSL